MYSGEYDACDVTLSVYPHRRYPHRDVTLSVYPHRRYPHRDVTLSVYPHAITKPNPITNLLTNHIL